VSVKRISGRYKTSQRALRYASQDDYPDPQNNAGSLIMSPIGQPLWAFPESADGSREAFWGIIPVVSIPGDPSAEGNDVAFITVIDFSVTFTVHETDPEAQYKTVGAALEFASRYKAAYLEKWQDEVTKRLTVEVLILSGHLVREQLHNYVDLSFVNLTSEDPVVFVDEQALTEVSNENFKLKAFIANYGTARSPQINTNFVSNKAGVPGTGYKSAGLYVGGNAWASAHSATVVNGAPIAERPWGLNGFDVNIHNAGHFEGYRGTFDYADETGLVNRGTGIIGSCSAIECTDYTIYNNGDLRILGIYGGFEDLFPGVHTQNYRRTLGADSDNDIFTTENGITHIENVEVLGGINIVPNSFTGGGICFDDRVSQIPKHTGPLSSAAGTDLLTFTASYFRPETDNVVSLGGPSNRFRDGYFSGNVTVGGNITVDGDSTISGAFSGSLSGATGTFAGTATGTGDFSTVETDTLIVNGETVNPAPTLTQGTIVDDDARALAIPATYGTFVLEIVDDATSSNLITALCAYDTTAETITAMFNDTDIAMETGVLSGTTGTDGKFSLSVVGSSLYVENRMAVTKKFKVNWLR